MRSVIAPCTSVIAAIPDAVKFACAQIVRNAQATPALNVRSESIDRLRLDYFSDTLLDSSVQSLLARPRFNARNPNRVRSLVASFALRNFRRFNAADGAGYTFAVEQVRAMDVINPQLASTIAGAFNLWRRFAEPRRTQMQRSLERIARTRGLSPDVREVVMRTLAG